ncbi:MAG: hypothetical protein Q8N05_18455 [Bacteroidota bacterium]|nr:hypothetical protein [Bacteroidota bacterium]
MKRILFLAFVIFILVTESSAQKTVGLDNWFNHENNAKTGKIFHYTWDDQANSGFSQLGDPWLYNEYIDHTMLPESFENLKAANNLVDLLLNGAGK